MADVLFIDSGVGGLSVWREVKLLNPNLGCTYVFDNRFFPYGEKPDDIIVERCVRMTKAVMASSSTAFDLVVVACNTASTVALPAMRSALSVPVVGVVPAVKPAAQLSASNVIGLLATPATIRRSYIDRLIAEHASNCRVIRVGSSLLVRMAEEKLKHGRVRSGNMSEILKDFIAEPHLDTVVLGCTHFPWLKNEIEGALPDGIRCIDSGEAIARRVGSLLSAGGGDEGGRTGPPKCHALMTDAGCEDYLSYRQLFQNLGFEDLGELTI
ncbi:MAG: glutamate racemase [Succinivibrionaceae bacterium]|nr:glutamate racemase [Succinivibrionaceae bacterium]